MTVTSANPFSYSLVPAISILKGDAPGASTEAEGNALEATQNSATRALEHQPGEKEIENKNG